MKAKYFFLALSAIALGTSCSNDEVTEVSDSNAIKFSVSTGKMSRADNREIYCNNTLPSSFKVWATYTPTSGTSQTYIAGDVITGSTANGITTWTNSTGNRYWPKDGSLSFFAHVHGTGFDWSNGSPKIVDYTVNDNVEEQQDLLYAVKTGQTKTVNSTNGVNLNFRHALSQIVFQAKNTNENLYVEIDQITIGNVGSKGTFTYPTSDTDNNITHHPTTSTATIASTSQGTWNTTNEGQATSSISTPISYTVGFGKVGMKGNVKDETTNEDIIYPLTTVTKTGNVIDEYSKKALLLLPQSITAWDKSVQPQDNTNKGSYFFVKCTIYNVADKAAADYTNNVPVWGTKAETANIAVPVSINWEQGKKYIYTFIFGQDNGGVDPNHPDDPDKPALFPITFKVTVDDFVDGGNTDVNMKTN